MAAVHSEQGRSLPLPGAKAPAWRAAWDAVRARARATPGPFAAALVLGLLALGGAAIVWSGGAGGDAAPPREGPPGPEETAFQVEDLDGYRITSLGPAALPLQGGELQVVADGIQVVRPLADLAPQLGSTTWQPGQSVCVAGPAPACLLPAAGLVSVTVVQGDRILARLPQVAPTSAPSLSGTGSGEPRLPGAGGVPSVPDPGASVTPPASDASSGSTSSTSTWTASSPSSTASASPSASASSSASGTASPSSSSSSSGTSSSATSTTPSSSGSASGGLCLHWPRLPGC